MYLDYRKNPIEFLGQVTEMNFRTLYYCDVGPAAAAIQEHSLLLWADAAAWHGGYTVDRFSLARTLTV